MCGSGVGNGGGDCVHACEVRMGRGSVGRTWEVEGGEGFEVWALGGRIASGMDAYNRCIEWEVRSGSKVCGSESSEVVSW